MLWFWIAILMFSIPTSFHHIKCKEILDKDKTSCWKWFTQLGFSPNHLREMIVDLRILHRVTCSASMEVRPPSKLPLYVAWRRSGRQIYPWGFSAGQCSRSKLTQAWQSWKWGPHQNCLCMWSWRRSGRQIYPWGFSAGQYALVASSHRPGSPLLWQTCSCNTKGTVVRH